MTIQEALIWAKQVLRKNNVEGAEASSELLLQDVLKREKAFLFANTDVELTGSQLEKYETAIARRAKHEPVWYITGKIEFMGLELVVNNNVLIPRPETELLIEKILESVNAGFTPRDILEVGTGSGAIVLSLCSSLREGEDDALISFSASDVSAEALNVAKANAKALKLQNSIDFRVGDLLEPWVGQQFDLIVANLPYVPIGDKDSLAADLTSYEPHLALFGGDDGLVLINRLLDQLPLYLEKNGKVFLEIGYGQGDKIQEYVSKILPSAVTTVIQDYAAVDRIVIIET